MTSSIPLAERMRPTTLEQYIGQTHLVGPEGVLRKLVASRNLSSFILWGPPGVGKTTLAQIMARSLERKFFTLSAINAGVKEVREVLEKAKSSRFFDSAPPVLFIDEIHRFNKAQQDSLLGAVEQGVVTLIGATTENPSFEVIRPLLSRCQVYILKPLAEDDLRALLDRVIKEDICLKEREIRIEETGALFAFSGGDARKLLNIVDMLCGMAEEEAPIVINDETVRGALQQNVARYDKGGEEHYDVISRRLCILASEDIGLANPNALLLAEACFNTVHNIGMPEARITLAQATIYLATSPKSNSAYMAINKALAQVEREGYRPVPLHLRNAPTPLMEKAGYGTGYKYAHDYPGHFVELEFMPEGLSGTRFWEPGENPAEEKLKARMEELWGGKY